MKIYIFQHTQAKSQTSSLLIVWLNICYIYKLVVYSWKENLKDWHVIVLLVNSFLKIACSSKKKKHKFRQQWPMYLCLTPLTFIDFWWNYLIRFLCLLTIEILRYYVGEWISAQIKFHVYSFKKFLNNETK